jgi:hypothetical protein
MKLSKLEIKVDLNGDILIFNEDTPYETTENSFICHGGSDYSFIYYPTGKKEKFQDILINYCISMAQKAIAKNTTTIEKLMKLR